MNFKIIVISLILLCFSIFSSIATTMAEESTAEKVVQDVKKVYSQIESYEDTSKRTFVVAGSTTTMECNLVYKTLNKVYHSMGDTKIISDGNILWSYNPLMNLYTKEDVEEMPERLGRSFMVRPILPLLLGQVDVGLAKGWLTDPTSWILQIGKLDGRDVYIIEVPSEGNGKQIFWIGKQDFLIYKLQTSAPIMMSPEESGPPMTITDTHSNIKINEVISEDKFNFVPPSGANLAPSNYTQP